MAEENWTAQLSVKVGSTGSTMVNLRAGSVADLAAMASELADLGAVIVSSAEEFAANATVIEAFPGAQVSTEATSANDGTPVCAHGVRMTFKAGTSSKNGKPYKMYFCDVTNDPRLPKCPARFLND